MKIKYLLLPLLLWGLTAAAAGLPREEAVPGGIALVELEAQGDRRPAVRYDDRPVTVVRNDGRWWAVVGIPLTVQPGSETVTESDGKRRIEHRFTVSDKRYEEQHLTVPKQYVTPDKEQLARYERDRKEIDQAIAHRQEQADVPFAFRLPVEGPRSSSFGLRRFFNGEPRNPHKGIDIAATLGTPIESPAAGVVVTTGDYFFNGRTVFVDHGQGLITMVCHLDRIDVKAGQRVAAGERLGLVGKSGRVTAPHLHWSVLLNRTMIDPELFLDSAALAVLERKE